MEAADGDTCDDHTTDGDRSHYSGNARPASLREGVSRPGSDPTAPHERTDPARPPLALPACGPQTEERRHRAEDEHEQRDRTGADDEDRAISVHTHIRFGPPGV